MLKNSLFFLFILPLFFFVEKMAPLNKKQAASKRIVRNMATGRIEGSDAGTRDLPESSASGVGQQEVDGKSVNWVFDQGKERKLYYENDDLDVWEGDGDDDSDDNLSADFAVPDRVELSETELNSAKGAYFSLVYDDMRVAKKRSPIYRGDSTSNLKKKRRKERELAKREAKDPFVQLSLSNFFAPHPPTEPQLPRPPTPDPMMDTDPHWQAYHAVEQLVTPAINKKTAFNNTLPYEMIRLMAVHQQLFLVLIKGKDKIKASINVSQSLWKGRASIHYRPRQIRAWTAQFVKQGKLALHMQVQYDDA